DVIGVDERGRAAEGGHGVLQVGTESAHLRAPWVGIVDLQGASIPPSPRGWGTAPGCAGAATTGPAPAPARHAPPATRRPGCEARRSARSPPRSRRRAAGTATPRPR